MSITIPRLSASLLALLPVFSQDAARRPASSPRGGDDLSAELEAIRAATDATGLVALAVQDGAVVAWGAAGVRVAGSKDPLRIEDPIHLGSCTKAMTATLVARLVEDGVLAWDTTIAQALPEFSKEIDPGFHGITVEQLLRHLGGIAERRRPEISALHEVLSGMRGPANVVRRDILGKVLAQPPSPSTAGAFDYSNFGYMTVGLMLEERTGKTWEELMVDKLFEPMDLASAGIGSPAGEGVPVGHLRENDAWSPLPPGPAGYLPDAMAPAGLAHMNLFDWAKVVGEHLAGERGEDGLVSAASYRRLHADPGTTYAAGWGLSRLQWSWGESSVLTHNGSDNTWLSLVLALPEWDIAILTAANCAEAAGQQATDQAKELLLRTLGLRD